MYLITEYQEIRGLVDRRRCNDCCDPIDGTFRCHSRCQYKKSRSVWQIVSLYSIGGVLFRWVERRITRVKLGAHSKLEICSVSVLHFVFEYLMMESNYHHLRSLALISRWDVSCKLKDFNDTHERCRFRICPPLRISVTLFCALNLWWMDQHP